MNQQMTEQEFNEWKQHPGTKLLWRHFNNLADRLKNMWANGDILESQAVKEQVKAIFIAELMNTDYDFIMRIEQEREIYER